MLCLHFGLCLVVEVVWVKEHRAVVEGYLQEGVHVDKPLLWQPKHETRKVNTISCCQSDNNNGIRPVRKISSSLGKESK